ncbi:MAG TPA: DUF4291 domain-containing protein [Polyangiaceae bacterium]|jgi:hypothetical protein
MTLVLEPYADQLPHWPNIGRHILAQFDDESVVVYQVYRPEIGLYAAEHGTFGAGFSFSRMTWIKPNFLWMMFRSGWGTKEGQEVTLAIRLRRAGFDALLCGAVASSHHEHDGRNETEWRHDLKASTVRLQWDPDHDPSGAPVQRRAIQLGIRGETLQRFVHEWILAIENVSEFVAAQRTRERSVLLTPRERVYPAPADALQMLGMTNAASTKGVDA